MSGEGPIIIIVCHPVYIWTLGRFVHTALCNPKVKVWEVVGNYAKAVDENKPKTGESDLGRLILVYRT